MCILKTKWCQALSVKYSVLARALENGRFNGGGSTSQHSEPKEILISPYFIRNYFTIEVYLPFKINLLGLFGPLLVTPSNQEFQNNLHHCKKYTLGDSGSGFFILGQIEKSRKFRNPGDRDRDQKILKKARVHNPENP